jgi:hypothetical protein
MSFDLKQGTFFRFRRVCAINEVPANAHSVQHFWLCGRCAETYTLQYNKEHGVLISLRLMMRHENVLLRVIVPDSKIAATRPLYCIGESAPGNICEPCHLKPVTGGTEDYKSMQSQLK